MSKPKLILSRRGFIGVMSAVVAAAAIPKLPAETDETKTETIEVPAENWLQVSAFIADNATLRERKQVEDECRRALRAGFRKRGLRPVGKPRLREQRVLTHCATLLTLDQIGTKWGHTPSVRLS